MKITVPAKNLADALSWVATAVPARPAVPVLAGVLVEATSDQLTVSAFDYDTAMRAVVDGAIVDEPGVAVIPGKVFAAIAARMSGDVELTSAGDGPGVELSAGKARYTLDTMPVQDYPELGNRFVDDTTATVDASVLQATFGKVAHAVAHDDTIPALTGVHMESLDGMLQVTTSDRYRVASYYLEYAGAFGAALPPAKAFHGIVKGLRGQVSLGHTSGILTLADSRHQASLRTIEAPFPKVSSIFRGAQPCWGTKFSREAMIAALDRLISVNDAAQISHPVTLHVDDDLIEVRSHSDSRHAGSEWVPCTSHFTDTAEERYTFPVTMQCNPTYLLDALKAHSVDEIEFGTANPEKYVPIVITGDAAMSSLLMPQRQTNS